jgi:hypothetical protein
VTAFFIDQELSVLVLASEAGPLLTQDAEDILGSRIRVQLKFKASTSHTGINTPRATTALAVNRASVLGTLAGAFVGATFRFPRAGAIHLRLQEGG